MIRVGVLNFLERFCHMTSRFRYQPGQPIRIVELLALLCGLAILAAAVLPVYRSLQSSAYESEILRAMSMVKNAQDAYYSQYKRYAGNAELQPIANNTALDLSTDEFSNMKFVESDELYVATNHPRADEFLVLWLGSASNIPGPSAMAMNQNGEVFKSEGGTGDWMPGWVQ